MKAYCQGEVDYFCGVYAIINSVRLACRKLHDFSYEEGCRFYQHMIQYLYDTNQFIEVLYHGTSFRLMDELLGVARKYLYDTYGLKLYYKHPLKFKDYPIRDVYSYVGTYLSKDGSSCIFRLHDDVVGDHWSVIRKKKWWYKLKLFDSYFYEQINIRRATWECYAADGLCHLAREGLIFIKVKKA